MLCYDFVSCFPRDALTMERFFFDNHIVLTIHLVVYHAHTQNHSSPSSSRLLGGM
jgi:hypothetical protein